MKRRRELLGACFLKEVRLQGNNYMPRCVSMENAEDRSRWSIDLSEEDVPGVVVRRRGGSGWWLIPMDLVESMWFAESKRRVEAQETKEGEDGESEP